MNFIEAAKRNDMVRRRGLMKHCGSNGDGWLSARWIIENWKIASGTGLRNVWGEHFDTRHYVSVGAGQQGLRAYQESINIYQREWTGISISNDPPLVTWEDFMSDDWEYKTAISNVPTEAI